MIHTQVTYPVCPAPTPTCPNNMSLSTDRGSGFRNVLSAAAVVAVGIIYKSFWAKKSHSEGIEALIEEDEEKRDIAMSPEEFRKRGYEMIDFVVNYFERVESLPVRSTVDPGYLAPLLPKSAPESTESWDAIMGDVEKHIVPGLTHWQSPNFFAYYPANTSYPGILGEILSATFNVIGFSWVNSPACTELETVALDWVAKLLQLPEAFLSQNGRGGGAIQGTASEATLVATLAARGKKAHELCPEADTDTLSELYQKFVVYSSSQAHSSIQKACMVAGIHHIRLLPGAAATQFSLDPAALQKAIDEDVAAGLIPIAIISTVGTTSSAAVDDIATIGKIAQTHGVWHHVDAAYAGSAMICPEFRHHLDGIELADSFNFNMHKWMLVPFDCAPLYVQERKWLTLALGLTPVYMQNQYTRDGTVIDYKDWQVPLGRRFRSLKAWMVLRTYGAEGLRSHIRGHVRIAKWFEDKVGADGSLFEVVAPRFFALVCFRLLAGGMEDWDVESVNEVNHRLLDAVNETGEVFLVHTKLDDVFTLRFAVGNPASKLRHARAFWKLINEKAVVVATAFAAEKGLRFVL